MRLGMNMLLWTTFVTEEHVPLFARIKAAGFDGVELPLPQGDAAHWTRIRSALDDAGLDCTTVASFDASTDPLSDDASVRQKADDKLAWALEMSQLLGSSLLCGPMHSAHMQFTGQPPTERELDRSADVVRRAGERASQAGITLAIEPLNRFETHLLNTAAQCCDYLARVNHPSVKILYDTHHANLEEKDSVEAIRTLGLAGIGHVHLSENDRGTPGEGQVDFASQLKVLHEMGYEGWFVVEAFSRIDEEFASALHIYRDLFPSAEHVVVEGAKYLRGVWREVAG